MNEIRYGRKRSAIKRALTAKLDEWLATINDVDVASRAAKDVIVTGGSIASMLLGEKVKDYDLYFRTFATTQKVAEYYVGKFNDRVRLQVADGVKDYAPEVRTGRRRNIRGVEEERVFIYLKSAGVAAETQGTYAYFEGQSEEETVEFVESAVADRAAEVDPESADPIRGAGAPYRPVFMSENAITLSDGVQLVVRFFGEPAEIHSNYDFEHATCYFDLAKNDLVLPGPALECLLSRTLVYRGSLYPVASIFRMKKFLTRGWRITAGQQLKIMWQISELDLRDPRVLQEQLTGVDQAYMWQLIQALRDVEPEKINSTYVAELIERIFE